MMTIILLGLSTFCLGVIITFLVVCKKIFKYEDSIEYKDIYIQELEKHVYRGVEPDFDQLLQKLDEEF